MSDLSHDILKEIKQRDIKPTARWRFILHSSLPWAFFGAFMIIGAIAVSVTIFAITDHDWDIYMRLHRSFLEFLVLSIPYFWLILVAGFFALAWHEVRETKHGYKFSLVRIGLVNVLGSVILGLIFFYAGLGIKIENVFANNIPFYEKMQPMRSPRIWENPQGGLLIGEITQVNQDTSFVIRDLDSQNWLITCLKCLWRPQPVNIEGLIVKIIGAESKPGAFDASEIRPWRPGCGDAGRSVGINGCRPQ